MPLGFTDPEDGMNAGKTLFAQVMEFVPWKTFGRIVIKHKGDSGVDGVSRYVIIEACLAGQSD
jgi:hypothetical protein